MKEKLIFILGIIFTLLYGCNSVSQKKGNSDGAKENSLIGKWVRMGHSGPVCFDFKENGMIEADFGNDGTIEVKSMYEVNGDTIYLIDKEGQICEGLGEYKIYQTPYYLAFDLIDENCSGRIKATMGFWVRPDYKILINRLDKEIEKTSKPELFLNRARMYMALGKSNLAQKDFDTYILSDSLNARVYINRAGTRFPNDLEGAVIDCNKAIAIDTMNKNAYFLRGLARYELGEKELGCSDFYKAIELGFSVLQIAEQEKCEDFWYKDQN